MYLHQNEFPQEFVYYAENDPSKIVSCTIHPKFLQINSPPGFFLYFFFGNFYGNSLRRGYCTKTKQEWPDSGLTLENVFVVFTKLIPRRTFFCIAKILVLMVFAWVQIQAPHVFVQKWIPQEFFPACIGFVPGGSFQKAENCNHV